MSPETSIEEFEELKELFDYWALEGLDEEMASAHQRTAKNVIDRIPLSPEDRILDIGTGNGFAARSLSSQEPDAYVDGLDLSPEMIRNASTSGNKPEVEYIVGDLHSIPIQKNSYDYIFMMDVIQYSPDPEKAFYEMKRVLKPSGELFCANTLYAEVVDVQPELADREGIRLCWNKNEFKNAFRTYGFNSVQQYQIPDMEVNIPTEEDCKQMGWSSRSQAETVYRELGTLLTIGVAQ
jgi:ubiquinone/menaquinone biosynthesis C-methylase UbiE